MALAEKGVQGRPAMIFDAVYVIKKGVRERTNLTHPLLDFYDEEQELSQFCERSIIVLSPDKQAIENTDIQTQDMR